MPFLASYLDQSNCFINLIHLSNQRSICVGNFVWQRFICLDNPQFKFLVNPDAWMHRDYRPSRTKKKKTVSFVVRASFFTPPFVIKVTHLTPRFMWLNCCSDDDERWLPPRLLNVNHCQSPFQTYKHHHRVSHAKRPTTTPITIKMHQMSSHMFRELASSIL